ncbi:MAG: addiction module protein [Acidobacteria bacterium]|nr:addiction module protein [Acidobacteriota bacterium]
MAEPVKILESQALKLRREDRAELAKVLLLSLDGPEENDHDLAWAEEAERRLEELQTGAVEAIPSERVFREARERLR